MNIPGEVDVRLLVPGVQQMESLQRNQVGHAERDYRRACHREDVGIAVSGQRQFAARRYRLEIGRLFEQQRWLQENQSKESFAYLTLSDGLRKMHQDTISENDVCQLHL